MDNKIIFILIFGIGATVGSIATWQYAKKKYERIAQEEIDSVKAVFSKRKSKSYADETSKEEEKWPAANNALKICREEGYTNYSSLYTQNDERGRPPMDKPYIISPDEFGELDDYEKISLTYYADRILTDENDEVIDNVDEIVGTDSLTHFGEYEDDSVFVRNNKLRCDYEILLDQRAHSEVFQTSQY